MKMQHLLGAMEGKRALVVHVALLVCTSRSWIAAWKVFHGSLERGAERDICSVYLRLNGHANHQDDNCDREEACTCQCMRGGEGGRGEEGEEKEKQTYVCVLKVMSYLSDYY